MYQLLRNEGMSTDIKTKVSAELTVQGFDGVVEYLGAPLIEKYTFKDKDGDGVGVIYTKLKLDKTLNMQVENSEIAGDIDVFAWLANFTGQDERILTIEWDEKPKGNQSRVRKLKRKDEDLVLDYRPLENETAMQLEEGTIENLLYKSPTYEEAAKDKDLTWIERYNKDYKLLITKEETDNYIEQLHNLPKDTLLSIDTETSGLNADRLLTDELVGISLSYKTHTGVYIPLQQKYGQNNDYTMDEVLKKLKPLIDVREETSLPLIGHNLAFDWKVFKMYDIEINIVHDTYLMMALMHWARNTFIRGLKQSVEHYFGIDVLELGEMFEPITKANFERLQKLGLSDSNLDTLTKRKLRVANTHSDMMDFRYAPEWFYTLYGPADGDFPLWLYDKLTEPGGDWKRFNGKLDMTYQLEIHAIPSFQEQEFFGIRFISEGIDSIREKAEKERDQLEAEIYEMVGYEFNIASGLQLGKVLFEEMGCPQLPKFRNKKSGNWKTDKATLDRLSSFRNPDGSEQFPIVHLLNRFSKLNHVINSFYNNLPKLVRKGYLFPQYNPMGAATGRVTCKDPNVQQMEPSVRTFVVPDTDEYYFAICDFSQIERRVMGGMSGDSGINDRFINDPEADSHIQTYAQMTDTPYEQVTPAQRSIGKTLNFATAYGVGDEKLAMNVFGKDDAAHQAQAADLRKAYFDSVPLLDKYLEDQRDRAEIDGYASTYFGRQRYIKEFNYDTIKEYTREKGRRAAGNMVIQGTAADIQKIGLVLIRQNFRKYGYFEDRVSIRMNVHDEVTVMVHKDVHPFIVCKIMKESMEMDLSEYGFPPFYIGMNLGTNWKDGKRDDLEAPVLLMEEMKQLATEHLENGTPLPEYDTNDVVGFWLEEIKNFSLRQLIEEVELGYIDENDQRQLIHNLETAHRNPRISKYASYFTEIADPIWEDFLITEVVNHPSMDYLYDNWDDIKAYNTQSFRNAMQYINDNRPTRPTNTNIWHLSYLGYGYQDVLDYLQENKTVTLTGLKKDGWKYVAEMSDGHTIQVSASKDTNLTYPKVWVPGEEVDGGALTVEELIIRDLSKVGGLFTFNMQHTDPDFIALLESTVVPTTLARDLNIEGSTILLTMPAGTVYRIQGVLPVQMHELLIEMIISYYVEEGYDHLTDRINELQDQVLSEVSRA